ncbi:hypothetical protein BIT28_03945 [Photobacterium proteolyticum]|uniref:EF-hand domain-containing protein n=1 Tax=Photobacterium proteolyticum TaxID=1903952 RepID=A0A1Q9GAH7_9GAMM|nr:hypothetical protein [Photobacterium proteolyticum]OLQ71315.1 hypothetical protein BIT28_03945 [Photobacterium proteolyticum]
MKWKIGRLALAGFIGILQWPAIVHAEAVEQHTAVFPKPDGQYQIGFHQFEVTEEERWIQVSAWYPSEAEAVGEQATYVIPAIAKVLQDNDFPESEYKGLPASWSFFDLPAASGKHPVLIYNHGFNTFPRQSMTRFEYLASHGYIVLAVGHPEDTMAIERDTGDVVYQLDKNINGNIDKDDLAALITSLKRMSKAESQLEWQEALSKAVTAKFANGFTDRFDTWYTNNMMLVDALSKIQSGTISTPLQQHMDLEEIASFGHSFGGNVSVILANKNPEIKAGVNLDGAMFNWTMDEKLTVPTCFFYSNSGESFPGLNDSLFNDSVPVCSLSFNGASHMSFTDLTYTMPDGAGKVNGYPIGQAIDTNLKAFFDAKLKHANSWPPVSNEGVIQK